MGLNNGIYLGILDTGVIEIFLSDPVAAETCIDFSEDLWNEPSEFRFEMGRVEDSGMLSP